MKKSITLATAAFIGLSGITGIATSTQTVSAATPSLSSSYWKKARKVKVTKNVVLRKVKNDHKKAYIGKKTLKKGSIVEIKKGNAKYAWRFSGNIPNVGKAWTHKYFWTYPKKTTNWFTTSLKKSKTTRKTTKTINSVINKSHVDTSVLSNDEIQFLKSSSTPLVSKIKKTLSYTGAKKKAADYILMGQLDLTDKTTGKPEVSYSKFENQISSMNSKVSELQSWLNG